MLKIDLLCHDLVLYTITHLLSCTVCEQMPQACGPLSELKSSQDFKIRGRQKCKRGFEDRSLQKLLLEMRLFLWGFFCVCLTEVCSGILSEVSPDEGSFIRLVNTHED